MTIKQDVAPTTDRDSYARSCSSRAIPRPAPVDHAVAVHPGGLLTPTPSSWINANFILPNNIKGKDYIPPTNSEIIPLVYYNKMLFAKAGITAPTHLGASSWLTARSEGGAGSPRSSWAATTVRGGDAADRRADADVLG